MRSLTRHPLYALKNGLLELALDLVALLVGGGLAVESHEGAEVELGLLEELDLADVDLKHSSLAAVCLTRPSPVTPQQSMWGHVRSGGGRCPG